MDVSDWLRGALMELDRLLVRHLSFVQALPSCGAVGSVIVTELRRSGTLMVTVANVGDCGKSNHAWYVVCSPVSRRLSVRQNQQVSLPAGCHSSSHLRS